MVTALYDKMKTAQMETELFFTHFYWHSRLRKLPD
jgi:hypothetical protein